LEGDQVVPYLQRPVANDGDVVVATIEGETNYQAPCVYVAAARCWFQRIPNIPQSKVRAGEPIIQGVVVGLLREYPRGRIAHRRSASRTA